MKERQILHFIELQDPLLVRSAQDWDDAFPDLFNVPNREKKGNLALASRLVLTLVAFHTDSGLFQSS